MFSQRNIQVIILALTLILLAIALCNPTINYPINKKHVIFLIDESYSIDANSRKFIDNFLDKTIDGLRDSEASLIYFAKEPVLRNSKNYKQDITKNDRSLETNIASAITTAIKLTKKFQPKNSHTNSNPNSDSRPNSHSDSNTDSRLDSNSDIELDFLSDLRVDSRFANFEIVLISDGNETAGDAFSAAISCPIPISTIPVLELNLPEVSVSSIAVPPELKSGEPFNINLTIYSNRRTEVKISIFRNAFKIVEESKKLEIGESKFQFYETATGEPEQEFFVQIESLDDTISENNISRCVAVVGGEPRVLMIESERAAVSDFVSALQEHNIKVEVRPAEGFPASIDELAQFDAVIISNVPASAFSLRKMDILRNYVHELGGGLTMIGGDKSFGQGGFYKTAIEDILPVSCNFDDQKEKPTVAISLVIDRSGSMDGKKIEFAKDAAKGVIELLSPDDFISIIAYDAIPHVIVPPQKVTNPRQIKNAVNSINSSGGTNVYQALTESFEQLNSLNTETKHVILLTDGKSESGDIETIIRRMTNAGITISTIGTDDADNKLLQHIADIGEGRFYQTDNPNHLPQIFIDETISTDKTAINETPFVPIIVTKSDLLAGIDASQFPPLLGFIRTKPKSNSRLILATETGEPLLIWRRYGTGIAAAFTSDVKNRWSAEWLAWNDFAKLWSQIIRRTLRQQKTERTTIEYQTINNTIDVTINAVDQHEQFVNNAKGHITVIAPDLSDQKIPLVQVASGRYNAKYYTNTQGNYRVKTLLQKNDKTLAQQIRGVTIGYPKELQMKPVNIELLKRISEATKGTFNPSPDEICNKTVHTPATKKISIRLYLLVLALCFFVIDLILRRCYFEQVSKLK
ncbi:MAG: VWA domain-containing protein [Planctomycetaceae bacterium]|jgi:uncharacterized membrane protein|nr:VWA domain-containing protein [Planctomycetaceae bacterium]